MNVISQNKILIVLVLVLLSISVILYFRYQSAHIAGSINQTQTKDYKKDFKSNYKTNAGINTSDIKINLTGSNNTFTQMLSSRGSSSTDGLVVVLLLS